MDSISQAVLGASVAGAVAGRQCNVKVLLAGAALGTLPDLDVLIDYGSDIANVVKHRGFSHSLFVLTLFSWSLTALLKRFSQFEAWGFMRLGLLIWLSLITHPLLDSFTTYGTQLFWPLSVPSVALNSVFIIDPLYTLPLIIGLCFAWRRRAVMASMAKACRIGLFVSCAYLLWSLAAQQMIMSRVQAQLVATPLENSRVLVSASPFNTLLWRVVVMGEEHYWEGTASLLDSHAQIDFSVHPIGRWPFDVEPQSLRALRRFTHDYLRFEVREQQLLAVDLRLGFVNYHPFSFVMATQNEQGAWQALEQPYQIARNEMGPRPISVVQLWQRLWGDPLALHAKSPAFDSQDAAPFPVQ
ncbi:hypothetical protein VST7929_00912 [Vibrio stylophorae]|uniref:Metal-dependent hydrolase n=1 Tax=Vibrio stylophorae TaxID=659351 RepID=A0ABM8ZRY0_9VIBR|nr:metal-dependent hydrolase [Vibrio stylophorae]CAH0533060.1 hypothetical protein VST7929_00912 [Vibrio stylophorae]